MSQLSFVDDSPQRRPNKRKHDAEDDFSDISDELILRIFSYLPKASLHNCGLTNRRFRMLCLDETLWKRVDLGGKSISGELVHRMIGRGIQYLRLSKSAIAGQFYPNPPPQKPARLRYLDLSMLEADDPWVVYEILSRCTELVAVSLENCLVNELSCKALARNKDLQVLNLSSADGLTSVGIQSILTGCPNLREVNIAWTKLDRKSVILISKMAPESLRSLNLAGCRRDALVDEDISQLCVSCPNLVELDISDASELTAVSMEVIAAYLLHLRILSCSRCYKIDPLAYATLPPLLKELNIFNSIHEGSWEAFGRILPENLAVNASPFSSIARPTVGVRRTSIWGFRVRDE